MICFRSRSIVKTDSRHRRIGRLVLEWVLQMDSHLLNKKERGRNGDDHRMVINPNMSISANGNSRKKKSSEK